MTRAIVMAHRVLARIKNIIRDNIPRAISRTAGKKDTAAANGALERSPVSVAARVPKITGCSDRESLLLAEGDHSVLSTLV